MIFTNRYEVKNYLYTYKAQKREVERLNGLLRELDADLISLKATDYEKVNVKKNTQDLCVIEVILDEKSKLIKELEAAVSKKYELRRDIIDFICQISNKDSDCDILIDKHINTLSTRELCKKYAYDKEVLYNKISIAYKKLAKVKKEAV